MTAAFLSPASWLTGNSFLVVLLGSNTLLGLSTCAQGLERSDHGLFPFADAVPGSLSRTAASAESLLEKHCLSWSERSLLEDPTLQDGLNSLR